MDLQSANDYAGNARVGVVLFMNYLVSKHVQGNNAWVMLVKLVDYGSIIMILNIIN